MSTKENFLDYLERLEDYLEHVNTGVDSLLAWEPDMYAAYGSYNGLMIEQLREWYTDAEVRYITSTVPELYIVRKYPDIHEEDIWEKIEQELEEAKIYQVGTYWFIRD